MRGCRANIFLKAAVCVAVLSLLAGLSFAAFIPHPSWADEAVTSNEATNSQSNSASTENSVNSAQSNTNSAKADNKTSDKRLDSSAITLDSENNSVIENQKPDSSFIYDTDLSDLSTADSYYDQQTVQVVGEVIGDIVSEGDDGQYCWVTLWDDDSTVSVYMKRTDAEAVDTLGSYSRKGTMLQVRGEFNLVCSEHEGQSDIHATDVTVTSVGGQVNHAVGVIDFLPGILLLVAGFSLLYLFFRMREKEL